MSEELHVRGPRLPSQQDSCAQSALLLPSLQQLYWLPLRVTKEEIHRNFSRMAHPRSSTNAACSVATLCASWW
jgi:hypothetical protein